MRTWVLAIVATMASLWADADAAEWVQAESENFVFYGEVAPEKAQDTIRELEIFRSTILTLRGLDAATPEVRKVHVFGARNERGVQKLTGMGGIAGVYTTGDDYPVFVTTVGSKRRRDDGAHMVMLHEFSHHVVHTHTAQFYPRWLDEGMAEYFASFTVDGDTVTVGEPASMHALILSRPGWTDEEVVFNAVAEYPFEGGTYREGLRAGYFYGISWLAVHYLMSTPELGMRIDDYVALINEGAAPREAFERGFGLTQKAFQRRIWQYWQKNKFPMVQFKLGEQLTDPAVAVRAIPEAEARIALFEAEVRFRQDPKDRDRTRRDIEAMMAAGPPSAALFSHLSALAMRQDDLGEAVMIGQRAVEALPDDPLAIQTLADALFHQAMKTRGPQRRERLNEAFALFSRQLAIEPTSPTANIHLPTAALQGGIAPNQTVVNAVAFNLSHKRSPSNFFVYLDGAEVMDRVGAADEKCALLEVVGPWIRAADAALDDEARAKRRGETPLGRLERLDEGTCAAR